MIPFLKLSDNIKNPYKNLNRDVVYCSLCPKLCNFSCPVYNATKKETLSPWGKQTILFEIERKFLTLNKEFSDILFACLECHRCTSSCQYSVNVSASLNRGRAMALKASLLPQPLDKIHKKIREREELVRHLLENQFPLLDHTGSSRFLFMPGCTATLEDLKSVRNAVMIIKELAGEDTGIFSKYCCGLPYLHTGDIDLFISSAKNVAQSTTNASLLIVMDPGCAVTIQKYYLEFDIKLKPSVTTFVEFIATRIKYLKQKIDIPQPVFYHDPCHLARNLQIVDEPREILMRTIEGGISDLFYKKEKTLCCGGGGALPAFMPETAETIAQTLVKQFKDAGAISVITSCPTCKKMLQKSSSVLKIYDISEIIGRSLKLVP